MSIKTALQSIQNLLNSNPYFMRDRPEQEGRITRPMQWPEHPVIPMPPKVAPDTIRRKAYVCCAIAGDVEHNLDKAKTYCRLAYNLEYIPICPALMFLQWMDEESERARGLEMSMELLKDCSVLLVFGDVITTGMQKEINWWQENKQHHPIQYLSGAKVRNEGSITPRINAWACGET